MDRKSDFSRQTSSLGYATNEPPVTFDQSTERKVVRKCDLRIVPIMSWLFFLAYMDRFNISNASTMGLPKELRLSSAKYNATFYIFLVSYVLFPTPQNLMLRHCRPSVWISLNAFMLGIITLCTGFVQTSTQLLLCRFLLGIFECIIVPGCLYIMSMYFKPYELQRRFNFFFSFAPFAGAFGGLFAFACGKLGGTAGISGWRWIFIIEGIITTVCAVLAKPLLVDWPEKARFLTDHERTLLAQRLTGPVYDEDSDVSTGLGSTFSAVLRDWKFYLGILMFFPASNAGYAVSYFLPTIIQGLGNYDAVAVQVHTIPVWMTAWAMCLLTAFLSDKLQTRYPFLLLGITIGCVGYIILLVPGLAIGARYAATFFCASSFTMIQPMIMTWVVQNVSGYEKRAIVVGLTTGFGNCGGFVASNIFTVDEAPNYVRGLSVTLGLLACCGLMCTVYFAGLVWENRRMSRLGMGQEGRSRYGY
ncbi:putative transmembrane transporter [Rhizodiscina lignyota]|uniref:Transmembrane transporter n=1 Tax=Rhizodiscina lignyota TaxID=1504668 RepID=A0A9P4IFL5_9PEZI|nr:putative transmembrane transporter [Rhizodiscina lignyota]